MANPFDRFDQAKPGVQDRADRFAQIAAAGARNGPSPAETPNPFDRFDAGPATPAAPPAPAATMLDRMIGDTSPARIARSMATGVGDIAEGIGDVPGLIANPLNAGLNWTGLPQAITGAPLGTDLGAAAREATGLPVGQTPGERIVGEGISAASGGLVGAGLARLLEGGATGVTRSVLSELSNPALETAAGFASGVAQQGAQEAGLPWWAQMAAGLGGGLAGGSAALRLGRPRDIAPAMQPELVAAPLDRPVLALPDLRPRPDPVPEAPPALLPDLRGQPAPPANANPPVPTGNPNLALPPDVIEAGTPGGWDELMVRMQAVTARPPSPQAEMMASTAPNLDDLRTRLAAFRDSAPTASNDVDIPPPPAAPISFTMPGEGRISSDFGQRTAPKAGASTNHRGIDIAMSAGSPVRASAEGEVVFAGKRGGYGNQVRVRHPDGTVTAYSHLDSIGVKVGDRLASGGDIGASGSTGNVTGPHLHFEVFRDGQAVDPRTVMGDQPPADVPPIAAAPRQEPDAPRPIVEREPAPEPPPPSEIDIPDRPSPAAGQTGGAETPRPSSVPEPTFNRSRPEPVGREPSRPTGFTHYLGERLAAESNERGLPVRIDAEQAVDAGVPRDLIYHPNGSIKANAGRVFGSKKGSMYSREANYRSLDFDDIDPQRWGFEGRIDRLTPEEIGDLIRRDLEGDMTIRDRNDPRYEPWRAYQQRVDQGAEFFDRYGEDGHLLPDHELDRIDAENAAHLDAEFDDVVRAANQPDVDPWGPVPNEADYGAGPERFNDVQSNADTIGTPDLSDTSGRAAGDGTADTRQSQGDPGEPGTGRTGDPDSELRGQSTEPTQSDAFGERPGDQRAALERQAEGRVKGSAPQKAPGSDGGLFDTQGKSPELFSRARREGVGRDRPGTERLSDDLRRLATDEKDARVRSLADRLAQLVGDAEVKYGDDLGEGVAGRTRLDQDGRASAEVRRRGDSETLLHEAIHTATLTRYGELVDGAADGTAVAAPVRELERLLSRAQKAFGRRSADPTGKIGHALSSTDEFLAGALTSPDVQRFLQRQSTANLWGRFIDWTRGLLGLSPRAATLLDRSLRAGSDVIEGMAQDAPRAASETVLLSKSNLTGQKTVADFIFEPDSFMRQADAGPALRQAIGDPKAAFRGAKDRLDALGSATLYSADSALRSIAARFDAPTVEKLADMFHAQAGKAKGVGRTYHEAVERGTRTRTQRAFDALQPHIKDKAAMGRIRDMLATPTANVRATTQERSAAASIRDLLKETLEYRRAAGEEIGEVTDGYFPRLINADAVVKNAEKFRKAATELYRSIGTENPEAAADAWLLRISDSYAGLDGGLDQAARGTSGSASSKAREFGKQADVLLREFYQTDPFQALSGYLAGSVRRAEEFQRFGAKGAVGSSERGDWMKAHGTKTQWDVMRDDILSELRASGRAVDGIDQRIESIRNVNLGRITPFGSRAKRVVSFMHAWNQLGVMDRATISSLGDLAMGFVRGGPSYGFDHLRTSLGEFGRAVARKDLPPTDARRYAEAVGTANEAFASDLLRARADDVNSNVGTQLLIDKFYRKIGLQQLTDGGRIAATKTGQRFLQDLAVDLQSTSARTRTRAAHYLRELGVADPDQFGATLRRGAPSRDELLADQGFAADYGTALMRYVSQSILMPGRAEKPTWASHPVGSLFFALQSYSYGFKKNVLDRVARTAKEGIKSRDPAMLAPASGLLVLAGLTYLNDTYLRPALFGTNVDFAEESGWDTALRVADRAGFLGAASPIVNAFKGIKYRRSLTDSLSGAVVGRIGDGLTAGAGLGIGNSENTNSAERRAAGALYDLAIEPAADFLATDLLKGKAGTAAIFATGNRAENGVLPADREWFVSQLAGGKEE